MTPAVRTIATSAVVTISSRTVLNRKCVTIHVLKHIIADNAIVALNDPVAAPNWAGAQLMAIGMTFLKGPFNTNACPSVHDVAPATAARVP
jgi:hypothetical protein